MTDIFFSYSSKDRDRIGIAHKALTDRGFEVFWDLQVPAGVDWEFWIKARLEQSRCVIVFWTANSAASTNVRYEVNIAKKQGKLLQVLLEPLDEEHLPMGILAEQAVKLMDWRGQPADPEWVKLTSAVEEKATPQWLRQKADRADALEVALKAERQRVAEADAKVRMVEDAHKREVAAQGDLRREKDRLKEERDRLKAELAASMNKADALSADLKSLRSERDAIAATIKVEQQKVLTVDDSASRRERRADQGERRGPGRQDRDDRWDPLSYQRSPYSAAAEPVTPRAPYQEPAPRRERERSPEPNAPAYSPPPPRYEPELPRFDIFGPDPAEPVYQQNPYDAQGWAYPADASKQNRGQQPVNRRDDPPARAAPRGPLAKEPASTSSKTEEKPDNRATSRDSLPLSLAILFSMLVYIPALADKFLFDNRHVESIWLAQSVSFVGSVLCYIVVFWLNRKDFIPKLDLTVAGIVSVAPACFYLVIQYFLPLSGWWQLLYIIPAVTGLSQLLLVGIGMLPFLKIIK